MWPDPEARFRCADAIQLRMGPNGAEVWSGYRWIAGGDATVRVLEAFAAPARAADVVERLGAPAPEALLAVVATIGQLVRAGALVPAGDPVGPLPVSGLSSEQLEFHRKMLADRLRVETFLGAIRDVVRPGDVVVDVGAGTGLLSVAAARAGARVYAIEWAGIADVARQVMADNGVSDRVTLLRGDARVVELPGPADVMLCELVGSDPWNEYLLDILSVARTRLVKPGGRVIPSRVALTAMPVSIPEDRQFEWRTTPAMLDEWRRRYGIDFSAIPPAEDAVVEPQLTVLREAQAWALSAPATLMTVDLAAVTTAAIDVEATVTAARDGVVNAVAIGFDAVVAPGRRIVTLEGDELPTSWESPVWTLSTPVPVTRGAALTIRYRRESGRERPVITISCAS